MSDARTVSQLSLALGASIGAWWVKVISCGLVHDDETSGGRSTDVRGMGRPLVRNSNPNSAGDPLRGAPMTERHGITRQPDNPNVLEVDFQHFRFVRDVRRTVHGVDVSPLAGGVK